MTNSAETRNGRKVAKPLGVYIITVSDFVAVGVVPLVAIMLLKGNPDVDIPFLSFLLPIPAMVASVWAMAGDNLGRLLLLGLVTVSSLLMITNSLGLLAGGVVTGPSAIRVGGAIVRGLFWIGINWWYFNREATVAYYKRHKLRDTVQSV